MLELTTYKNYKELVKALGWEEKKSNNRASQMKQLEAMCKYHKEGQKFVIEEIYEEPKEIEDNRGKAKKDYSQYMIEDKYDKSIGIYKIVLGDQIYIGSTTAGFRERFISHISKFNTLPTKEMLDNGATFEILQICDDMTENEIRHIEDNWIQEYRNNSEWKVVNELKNVAIKGERKDNISKPKYTKVKINKNDLDKAIKLLNNNEIDFKL